MKLQRCGGSWNEFLSTTHAIRRSFNSSVRKIKWDKNRPAVMCCVAGSNRYPSEADPSGMIPPNDQNIEMLFYFDGPRPTTAVFHSIDPVDSAAYLVTRSALVFLRRHLWRHTRPAAGRKRTDAAAFRFCAVEKNWNSKNMEIFGASFKYSTEKFAALHF